MYSKTSIETPLEQDVPGAWHPTLGQKANCDFPGRWQNARFEDCEHPRYGMITCVIADKEIEKGEEIFVDYGYPRGEFPWDHPWYHEAKTQWQEEKKAKMHRKQEEAL